MGTKTLLQNPERARRFGLHLPVFFRQPQSPTWLEGTTENISYTGVLFRSPSSLAPETALELRLRIGRDAIETKSVEIRCKGKVVRVEQRNAPEASVAVAVAIKVSRIVRGHGSGGVSGRAPEDSVRPPSQ